MLLLLGLFVFFTHPSVRAAEIAPTIFESGRLDYKVGFLGNPSSSIPFEMTVPVPWTTETIGQLKELGFNTIQINVAWDRARRMKSLLDAEGTPLNGFEPRPVT